MTDRRATKSLLDQRDNNNKKRKVQEPETDTAIASTTPVQALGILGHGGQEAGTSSKQIPKPGKGGTHLARKARKRERKGRIALKRRLLERLRRKNLAEGEQ